jgi:hypothetical protein
MLSEVVLIIIAIDTVQRFGGRLGMHQQKHSSQDGEETSIVVHYHGYSKVFSACSFFLRLLDQLFLLESTQRGK